MEQEYVSNGLIRSRINENNLKDKNYKSRNLFDLAVETSVNQRYDNYPVSYTPSVSSPSDTNISDILYSKYTDDNLLLDKSIQLATFKPSIAQEELIILIRHRLGKLKKEHYMHIATRLSTMDSDTAQYIHSFLSYYLKGYSELHNKYGKESFGF